MKKNALLLFSGGQDSTTVLAWCLKKYNNVHLITFDYGQNHSIETSAAKNIAKIMKKEFPDWKNKIHIPIIFKISNLSVLNENALVSDIKINTRKKLPNTFVPGRNVLFYLLGATFAYSKNISDIVSGVCETDFSGYPDCRQKTILSVKKTINLAMEKNFNFFTPLMKKNKAETWQMAHNLGGERFINIIKKNTHSCYLGNRSKFNEWGYGCDNCPACKLRKKGWNYYKGKYNNGL